MLTPTTPAAGPERPRIVVKFADFVELPERGALDPFLAETEMLPVESLKQRFPRISFHRLHETVPRKQLDDMVSRALQVDPTFKPVNFHSYIYFPVPPDTNPDELAREAQRWPNVEKAYVDRPAPDPLVNHANDPLYPNQHYLHEAPEGIDAHFAWNIPGGDGEGISFIDVERGWTLDHEDLVAHGATLLGGVNLASSRNHGTAVLGEMCAYDNTVGCVGVAPKLAHVNVVSFNGSTRSAAILTAAGHLAFGDVMLIEAQVGLDDTGLLGPVEAYDAEYNAIRVATALGITVVEAGGNGTNNGFAPALDMDTWTDAAGYPIFTTAFRDSRAIIVSAATSTTPHQRLVWAPHGTRIDCYGWGEHIQTCASNAAGATNLYQAGFGGTSGASPMIAGAAVAVQGMHLAKHGFRLAPLAMRTLLHNKACGTPPAVTVPPAKIGVMPNLKKIATKLKVVPDVYIRDNPADTGEPHSLVPFISPDIIVRQAIAPNPQTAFGPGSGTEHVTDPTDVVAGKDNYIYMRVLNQGGSPAKNVAATLYWTEAATLPLPVNWKLIGSTMISSVPTGEILTVSKPIPWTAGAIPAPAKHLYCFVGVIGNEPDPAPALAAMPDMDAFFSFVQANNNVAWKNFNVVAYEPSFRDFVALPFMIPGFPNEPAEMQIEIDSRLPEGSRLMFDVPVAFANQARLFTPQATILETERRVLAPIAAIGRTRLEPIRFGPGAQHDVRLLLTIPEEARREASYDLQVRHLYKGKVIGGLAFRIVPKR